MLGFKGLRITQIIKELSASHNKKNNIFSSLKHDTMFVPDCYGICNSSFGKSNWNHHPHHPFTTGVDGILMDTSSQTPQFTITLLRSLIYQIEIKDDKKAFTINIK